MNPGRILFVFHPSVSSLQLSQQIVKTFKARKAHSLVQLGGLEFVLDCLDWEPLSCKGGQSLKIRLVCIPKQLQNGEWSAPCVDDIQSEDLIVLAFLFAFCLSGLTGFWSERKEAVITRMTEWQIALNNLKFALCAWQQERPEELDRNAILIHF